MLSSNLEITLRNAYQLATDNKHEFVTLEHLLNSLTNDKDAISVLKACGVEIEELKQNLDDFIKNAEDRIFNLVQEDVFRKNVQGTVTAGNRFLTAPNDFLLTFSLAVIDSTTNDYHFLLKKHPSFMQEYTPDLSDVSLRGLPKNYADYVKAYSTSSSPGSQ